MRRHTPHVYDHGMPSMRPQVWAHPMDGSPDYPLPYLQRTMACMIIHDVCGRMVRLRCRGCLVAGCTRDSVAWSPTPAREAEWPLAKARGCCCTVRCAGAATLPAAASPWHARNACGYADEGGGRRTLVFTQRVTTWCSVSPHTWCQPNVHCCQVEHLREVGEAPSWPSPEAQHQVRAYPCPGIESHLTPPFLVLSCPHLPSSTHPRQSGQLQQVTTQVAPDLPHVHMR